MSQSLKRALFGAPLVILVSYPIFSLKLHTVDIKLEALGADTQIPWTIAAAALAMLVRQLFRDRIPLKLGRDAGYKVSGNGLKNFLGLPSTQCWAVPALVVVAFAWPFFASRGAVDIATLILIYVISSIGLNIMVDLADLFNLGYVGFYAVDAYTYALLAKYAGFSFWTTLPIVGMMAMLFGFLFGFPVLRPRDDHLATVTFGLDEAIRILLCDMTEIIGGPNGIGSIPKPVLFGLTFERRASEGMQTSHEFSGIAYNISYKVILLHVVALLLVLLTLFMINRLMRMPIDHAWETLREDEVACRALDLGPTIVKLSTFTVGAGFAGFAGSFFAARQGLVMPGSFIFIESVMTLVIFVLGDMGSQLGVILTAVVVVLFQEMRGFNEYRMLISGLTITVMMVWRPQGLLPMQRPHLELKPWADRFSR